MKFEAKFARKFRATLTVSLEAGVQCDWSPAIPRSLPARQREALLVSYRAWRNDCLNRFADANGLVLCLTHQGELGDCIGFAKKPPS